MVWKENEGQLLTSRLRGKYLLEDESPRKRSNGVAYSTTSFSASDNKSGSTNSSQKLAALFTS